jgi:tRNA threonylcarbamoyl adenosine modification protein YeaZ
MNVLGIEFSTHERSVAVARLSSSGEVLAEHQEIERGGRSVAAFAMIEMCLEKTGIDRKAIDCLAIGVGPGSYMGTRLAVSLAHGWHFALRTSLSGVNSMECIAALAAAEGVSGKLLAVMDAQRGEFYIAGFDLSGGETCVILPLQIARPDQVKKHEQDGFLLVGPDLGKTFPAARQIWPRASIAARLAAKRKEFVLPENLTPIYLRETTFVKAAAPRQIM